MAKERLEDKAGKAVLEIREKVNRIYSVLKDVGMKLTHVIEYTVCAYGYSTRKKRRYRYAYNKIFFHPPPPYL